VPELVALVAEAKARGERVVFTNGVFDILHVGHVSYLEEAKSCGDRLVVAVNDDDSVRRLKGASRPVNSLPTAWRCSPASRPSTGFVPFSEDTPAELIAKILPDVLVKGGDYRVEQIAGGDTVLKNGGEVRVLGFKPGRSTTALIDALRRATTNAATAATAAALLPRSYCCKPAVDLHEIEADSVPAACFSSNTFRMYW
jgi:D-beta-D-heptose 7-phosphate kinase/D-beta-D-heptose 1-phosphate adenosyltransferase